MKKQVREKLIGILENHFKYDTMNSWNNSKQYARNVKIHNIDIPLISSVRDAAYDIIGKDWFHDTLRNCYIEEFESRQKNNWTIGFNGRSGGYCVLYGMSIETLTFKTRCDSCYKPTWYEEEITCRVCGKGTLRKLKKPMTRKQTSNKGYDDPSEMSDDSLIYIMEVLIDFNNTIEDMIGHLKYCAERVVEKKLDLETGEEIDDDGKWCEVLP